MLSVFLVKKRIVINSYLVVNLCLLLWIVISGIANNTNPLLVINYFAYVIIPVSIYFLVKSISQDIFKLKYLINILIIIQLPVLCLQYFLPDYILYSQKSIGYLDRMFGTFPLSSDHFLSFFLIINILYLGTKKSFLTVFDYFIIGYSIICVFLTNSLTSYLFLISTLAFIFFLKSNIYIKLSSVIISITVLVLLYFNLYYFIDLLGKPELLDMTNVNHINDGTAGRFQTFYFVFINDLSIFGNGPSSYYNPFKGGFQFNLNFSQLLWFYYDLGIIGLILLILLICSFLYCFKISNYLRYYLAILVLTYSFSSTILDQIVFLLTLNIFVFMFELREKKLYL
tara:strand:+ start:356 stop:1378 length:1023 start_codon:yes stop_codon:yes gene_type:complete